jgi:hypothetical protein
VDILLAVRTIASNVVVLLHDWSFPARSILPTTGAGDKLGLCFHMAAASVPGEPVGAHDDV